MVFCFRFAPLIIARLGVCATALPADWGSGSASGSESGSGVCAPALPVLLLGFGLLVGFGLWVGFWVLGRVLGLLRRVLGLWSGSGLWVGFWGLRSCAAGRSLSGDAAYRHMHGKVRHSSEGDAAHQGTRPIRGRGLSGDAAHQGTQPIRGRSFYLDEVWEAVFRGTRARGTCAHPEGDARSRDSCGTRPTRRSHLLDQVI